MERVRSLLSQLAMVRADIEARQIKLCEAEESLLEAQREHEEIVRELAEIGAPTDEPEVVAA